MNSGIKGLCKKCAKLKRKESAEYIKQYRKKLKVEAEKEKKLETKLISNEITTFP